jgi:hypothetical protein
MIKSPVARIAGRPLRALSLFLTIGDRLKSAFTIITTLFQDVMQIGTRLARVPRAALSPTLGAGRQEIS